MFPLRRRTGSRLVVVAIACVGLLPACGPARYAYFQPQSRAASRVAPAPSELSASADSLPTSAAASSWLSTYRTTPAGSPSAPEAALSPTGRRPVSSVAQSARHRNPDSYSRHRPNRLFSPVPVAHVAPKSQLIDPHSTSRKTHPLGVIAFSMAILSYAPLLLIGTGTGAWLLSLTLPLTAVLLGVASLTTINRNKDRFRGKGWAMAAITLGTGIMGMALIALAALSTSRAVKK